MPTTESLQATHLQKLRHVASLWCQMPAFHGAPSETRLSKGLWACLTANLFPPMACSSLAMLSRILTISLVRCATCKDAQGASLPSRGFATSRASHDVELQTGSRWFGIFMRSLQAWMASYNPCASVMSCCRLFCDPLLGGRRKVLTLSQHCGFNERMQTTDAMSCMLPRSFFNSRPRQLQPCC